jgi:hypothetical protein
MLWGVHPTNYGLHGHLARVPQASLIADLIGEAPVTIRSKAAAATSTATRLPATK